MKPADVAQLYLNYRSGVDKEPQDLTQEQAAELQKSVGGEKQYNTMLQWASKNFDEAEISRYDKVMESGDPDAAYFAVQALQAEVVRAMTDPRYEKDPAYRQDVYDKLERSNVQF